MSPADFAPLFFFVTGAGAVIGAVASLAACVIKDHRELLND